MPIPATLRRRVMPVSTTNNANTKVRIYFFIRLSLGCDFSCKPPTGRRAYVFFAKKSIVFFYILGTMPILPECPALSTKKCKKPFVSNQYQSTASRARLEGTPKRSAACAHNAFAAENTIRRFHCMAVCKRPHPKAPSPVYFLIRRQPLVFRFDYSLCRKGNFRCSG